MRDVQSHLPFSPPDGHDDGETTPAEASQLLAETGLPGHVIRGVLAELLPSLEAAARS